MPQASEDLRAMMRGLFGDAVGDAGPTEYLLKRGFRCDAWVWRKPSPAYAVTPTEYACVYFLCEEWDHGYDATK